MYKLDIDLYEALRGFTKCIKTIDNNNLTIKSEKIIKPNQYYVINGRGMPKFKTS